MDIKQIEVSVSMRRRIISIKQLVLNNKKEIIKSLVGLDNIEKKMEEKHLKRFQLY